MENDWKKRLGVVYSTNENFEYDQGDEEGVQTLPKAQQNLTVCLDKKNRKGKAVTLVTGFIGKDEDLKELGRVLKNKCGVGGSVKDGEILLQGDHRSKIIDFLGNEGYKVKRSGG